LRYPSRNDERSGNNHQKLSTIALLMVVAAAPW
jgi:hypothetical protein